MVVPSSLTVEDTVPETPSVDWSACPARKPKHAVKFKKMSQIPADQTETLQEAVAHLRQRVAALETRLDSIDRIPNTWPSSMLLRACRGGPWTSNSAPSCSTRAT